MSKPTPGPWVVEGSDNATPHILHVGPDEHPDIHNHDQLVCVMPAEIVREYNSWANARLIAAAPALLEALRIARDFIGGSDATWDGEVAALEAIDAALSAASGRAPTNKEE